MSEISIKQSSISLPAYAIKSAPATKAALSDETIEHKIIDRSEGVKKRGAGYVPSGRTQRRLMPLNSPKKPKAINNSAPLNQTIDKNKSFLLSLPLEPGELSRALSINDEEFAKLLLLPEGQLPRMLLEKSGPKKLAMPDYLRLLRDLSHFPKNDREALIKEIVVLLSWPESSAKEAVTSLIKSKKSAKIALALSGELKKWSAQNKTSLAFFLNKGPHFAAQMVGDVIHKAPMPAYFSGLNEEDITAILLKVLAPKSALKAADKEQLNNLKAGIEMALASEVIGKIIDKYPEVNQKNTAYAAGLNPKIIALAPLEAALILEELGAREGDFITTALLKSYREREGQDMALKLYMNFLTALMAVPWAETALTANTLQNIHQTALKVHVSFAQNLSNSLQEAQVESLGKHYLKALAKSIELTLFPNAIMTVDLLEKSIVYYHQEDKKQEGQVFNEILKTQAEVELIKSAVNLYDFMLKNLRAN